MKQKAILIIILFLALFLRVYAINWDADQHLHPDERFLTMVGLAEKIPATFSEYLDPNKSTLNPYNVNYPFFVYGTFPLTIAKIIAVAVRFDDYIKLTLLGRFLSALCDVGTVVVIYMLVNLWQKRYKIYSNVSIVAAFFYSIAVLPIQHAHFFVTESFLVFFLTLSVYHITKYLFTSHKRNIVVSALFFGLALSSKISALYSLPLIVGVFLLSFKKNNWKKTILLGVFFIGVVYFVVRIGDPKFFASANFFDIRLNPTFLENIHQLNAYNNADSWFPPGLQWINKPPILFSLINMAQFGVGLPYFMLACVGVSVLLKKRKPYFILLTLWIIGFFIYLSTQYVKSIRYFLALYPFIAIFAAYGFIYTYEKTKKYRLITTLVIISVLIWPLSFMSIYAQKNSRVAASEWMYTAVPEGAYLAEEHWDDWVPLRLNSVVNRTYQGEQMPVFDPDTDEKWTKINAILTKSDYYVITSSRAYKHILANPDRYPRMSAFYRDLFANKLNFKKIAEFHSYPTLDLGFFKYEFNDDGADEGFTVFDHPKVTIFKKT